jgi:ribonucleoside-triphosphate reductase (thioredoxin)
MDMLERVKTFNTNGLRKDIVKELIPITYQLQYLSNENEWEAVGQWMWENKDTFNGLSVLPYFGGSYTQAPFEDITEEQFNELASHLHAIDLTKVIELQ